MTASRGRALVYLALALVLGALSYAVGVGSLLGQRAEAAVLEASSFTYTPPPPLNLVSIPAVITSLVALALIAWVSHGFPRVIAVVLPAVLAIVASQLLKQEVLERPALFELDVQNTFPSGHMTLFAAVCAGLTWAVPRALAPLVAALGSAVVAIAGWQLLEFGWHRPSDLVGALSLVVGFVAVAALLRTRRGSRMQGRNPAASRFISGLNRMLGVMLSFTGVALVIGGIGLTLLAGWLTSPGMMLAGAQLAIVGASLVAMRAVLALTP